MHSAPQEGEDSSAHQTRSAPEGPSLGGALRQRAASRQDKRGMRASGEETPVEEFTKVLEDV